jgi:EAL domain-containing protein (putative c-di-GMP-specific phosphodiesterase class I)
VPLGNWILREACLRLRAWQDSQPRSTDVWMSVNLSGVQLRHPALVEQIKEALRDSGLDARSLVLELTEGIAMENPTSVKTLLMQLRAMGIRISIDDFGTGYSSLAYLRQFPVDSLKVDRSFVRGMETNKDMADIIGTMTVMAQQLGLHVVAEGVENEEQVVLLRRLQCESAQGYLFAKPLDVNRATDLLKTGLPPRSGGAGDKEPATSLGPESPIPQPGDDRSQSPTRRRLAIAAAALLALVTCAGLVARFTNAPRPAASSSSPLPLENADQGPGLGTFADTRVPIQASDTVAVTAAPAASGGRRREDLSAASPAQHPAVVTLDATAPPALGGSRASGPETPGPAVLKPTSVNVVHLHRVGSCQGRLVVSRTGVAFVPDDKTSKEAFALKYSDFLYTLEDSTLTIKTNDRIYRFKGATVAGKNDNGSQLHDAVESIARFR